MNRAFIATAGALALLMTGCSPAIHNLHVHDRIPQEQQKGYVQFSASVQKDNVASLSYVVEYVVTERQYNHTIPIHTGPMENPSPAISDRVGKRTYLIRYPTRVITRIVDERDSRSARRITQGPLTRYLNSPTATVVWIDESKVTDNNLVPKFTQEAIVVYQTKQIEVPIEAERVTPVSITYRVSGDSQRADSPRRQATFRGEITSLTAEPSRPVRNVVNIPGALSAYPTTFSRDYRTVFEKTIEAANGLGWDVLYRNEGEGRVTLKKSRFIAKPLVFSVGVYSDESGKTHVDISSDQPWQRAGSKNTELSLKHINEFYTALDESLAK